jgi:hypothetical protein
MSSAGSVRDRTICGPLALRLTPRMTGAHAIAGRCSSRRATVPCAAAALDAAELDDDVAVLEALHHAADHFADALAVLAVDVLALRLAHLLEDHLLGGLRRDASEILGRPRELDLHVDFRFLAVELLRFVERDLGRRRR